MDDWCHFCGEQFQSQKGREYVFYEGKRYPIHKIEYMEFWERGRLPYKDKPHEGIIGERVKDMFTLGAVVAGGLIIIYIAPRLATDTNITRNLTSIV